MSMLKGPIRISNREHTTSKAPSRSVTKIKSHDNLAQGYFKPNSNAIRQRQYSEPIRVLEQQGIVKCEGISMDEAWNRFGIRSIPTPANVQTVPPIPHISEYINQCSLPSPVFAGGGTRLIKKCGTSKVYRTAPTRNSFDPLDSKPMGSYITWDDNKMARQRGLMNNAFKSSLDMRPGHLVKRLVPSTLPARIGSSTRQRIPVDRVGMHQSPLRQKSIMSASSYGSAVSWVSPAVGSLQIPNQGSNFQSKMGMPPPSSINEARRAGDQSQTLHTERAIPRWRGTKSQKLELQEKQEKEQLQCLLGRPTGCEDSPYAICSQMRGTKKAKAVIQSQSQLPQPVRPVIPSRSTATQQASSSTKVARRPTVLRVVAPSCLKIRNVEERMQHTRRYSVDSLSSPSSDDGSSSTTTTATTSNSTKSVRFVDDEAQKLWRNLESTLGVQLGCGNVPVKGKESTVSRIPRLQPVDTSKSKSKKAIAMQESLPPTRIPKRQSRLPIPSKQQWEPKLKRNSSIISQTLQLLRSASVRTTSDTESHYSISYVGSLPQPEKVRREEAIQRRCWGEQALRVVM